MLDPIGVLDVVVPGMRVIRELLQSVDKSRAEKKTYQDKLEQAAPRDIYKYVLLINISALETYVAQARLQAQQSFNLSRAVALSGFIVILVAIGLSVALTVNGSSNLNPAYLAAVAGVLTEFISGVFFFLYSKTLSQINVFHDKLVDMQKTALTHLAESDDALALREGAQPRHLLTSRQNAKGGTKATAKGKSSH